MCSLCDIENGPPEPEIMVLGVLTPITRISRPWLIREDVAEAIIDAVALRNEPSGPVFHGASLGFTPGPRFWMIREDVAEAVVDAVAHWS